MRISVINMSHGLLSDFEIITAIRAINRQINEDFKPYWHIGATLRLEGCSVNRPDIDKPIDMLGDAIIYIWDKSDVQNALGYHDANFKGIPYGFVFADIAAELHENWTVTFSHEVLELLGDSRANTLVRGPHPRDKRRKVYHWHEMCDAVQDESYTIDGIEVSNFVLPLYFTECAEPGSRNDFLGSQYQLPDSSGLQTLASFGINPGGYIGFFDPAKNKHETEFGADPVRMSIPVERQSGWAEYRRNRKNKARMARRGNRYKDMGVMPLTKPAEVNCKARKSIALKKCKVEIYSETHNLKINSEVAPLEKQLDQGRGYFAHDIYADAKSVAKSLKSDGFEEAGALELIAADANTDTNIEVQLHVDSGKNEFFVAIIEVNGVFFWHRAELGKTGGAVFNLNLIPPKVAMRSRGGFVADGVAAVVRIIKHKAVDKVKDFIVNHLSDYLAKHVEKLAFNKKEPAKLYQLKLLDKPIGKTIGELVEHPQSLQSGARYLLLVHGIFSSAKGAFKELLLDRWDDNLLGKISPHYSKIVCFDHWTVAKDVVQNVDDLLKLLPNDCSLDIVCHSRGAGVVRSLLEHSKFDGVLNSRKINVGKVIFVAGACQGSPLADPDKIEVLVNTFSALNSVTNTYFPLQLITSLLKAVEYGVKSFPGIQCMSTTSPIFKELNKPINQKGCKYIYTRSNYEPDGVLLDMLDNIGLDKFVFKGAKNDGVVPYEGAATFDEFVTKTLKPIAGPEYGVVSKQHVFHTAFFEQQEVRRLLIDVLTGN